MLLTIQKTFIYPIKNVGKRKNPGTASGVPGNNNLFKTQ